MSKAFTPLFLTLLLFITAVQYDASAQNPKKKYYFLRIQENHKWGLRTFGAPRTVILPCEYDRMDDWKDGYAILGKGGKFGMMDSNAKIVVPLQYTEIREFHSGLSRVRDENGKYGFITPTTQFVFPATFDSAGEFFERETGRDILSTSIKVNGKRGLISSDGKTIIPPEMDEIGDFTNGMAICKKDGKYGFIGTEGQWLIQPQFVKLNPFVQGKALISMDGTKWGLINEKGVVILEAKYDEIKEYTDGMAQIRLDGLWGYINMAAQVVIKPQFTEERNFVEGFCAVKFPEKSWKEKISPAYKDFVPKAKLPEAGWGFVDKIGTMVTGPYFTEVHDFKNGIAIATTKSGALGYVNRRGDFKKN